MITKNQIRIHSIIIIASIVGMLLLGVWLPSLALAAPLALPPRPTPSPTPTPISETTSRPEPPAGAHIALRAPAAPPGAWSIVQWQDEAGDWHDVKGWQGAFDSDTQKVWWTAEKDFGTGPFRWMIHQGQGGRFLAASESFYLPEAANETMTIEVIVVETHQ